MTNPELTNSELTNSQIINSGCSTSIDRNKALEILKSHIKTTNMLTHCLCVEALMKGLARYFNENQDLWGLTGLMHDLDYEETEKTKTEHGPLGAELLKKYGFPEPVCKGALSHTGHARADTLLDKSLIVADALSGLVYAAALMRPDKKISTMNVKSIRKKFKSPNFAAGANRENIKLCESLLNIPLDKLFEKAIESMGECEESLGLGQA
jgi:putative nucleotidyltransferase with HDIG domain